MVFTQTPTGYTLPRRTIPPLFDGKEHEVGLVEQSRTVRQASFSYNCQPSGPDWYREVLVLYVDRPFLTLEWHRF